MDAIFHSFLLVALSEMGDKTQLLAFVLASRFKKPWVIFAGIFLATLLNHLAASAFGSWVAAALPAIYLKWILALTFFAFAVWILIPDKDEGLQNSGKYGAFLTTLVAFFLAEMGDKTQLATVALAAKYQSAYLVTLGSTLGMLLSCGAAIFCGDKITSYVSMTWIRRISCFLFVVFGLAILIGY